MDTAMRDLDLIQENRDDENPGRKAAMLGMAGLSTVALVFAMGVILGGGGEESEPPSREDPLAALAPSMLPEPSEDELAEDEASPEAIAPGEVAFHERLTDPRPEVEAALAAASAEAQVLAGQAGQAGTTEPGAEAALEPVPVAPAAAPAGDVARFPTTEAIPAVRPVASGRSGAFTLQVVSYRTRAEADLFAEALRGRGHGAFVARVELDGRGTYFRVRIGPFDNRVQAERYRATFEREENMNTYVVDEVRAAALEGQNAPVAD